MSGENNRLGRQTEKIIYFGDKNYFPKISVIMPVYNAEKYLHESIESILRQTFVDFELILINDGSKDNSLNLCIEYAKLDTRIKIVSKENGGVSSARNRGIKEARGRYMLFIDSDDQVIESFFEKSYKAAVDNHADISVFGIIMETYEDNQKVQEDKYTLMDSQNVYTPYTLLNDWDKKFPAICICAPFAKLYTAKIIKENGIYFDENMSRAEDTYFNLQLLQYAQIIYFSKECYYRYLRINANSLYGKFHKNIYEIHSKVFCKLRELMDCYNAHNDTIEVSYFSNLINGLYEHIWFYQQTTDKEKREYLKKVASDKYVRQYKLKQFEGKKKLFLFLLKIRAFRLILFMSMKRHKRNK